MRHQSARQELRYPRRSSRLRLKSVPPFFGEDTSGKIGWLFTDWQPMAAHSRTMTSDHFDAVITIGDHHLEAVGLAGHADKAVAAVREAVERIDGAGWIDVEALSFPPALPGWVIVYPRGRANTPATPDWEERLRQVEATAANALAVIGASL
jgi:hypothetical protein